MAKAFKTRKAGEGRSTEELFTELRAGSRDLEKLILKRRNRDLATRLLTDIYLAVEDIAKRFNALGREGINIKMISTSEIKISIVVEEKYLELAVRVLHKTFGLDKAE